MERTKETPDLQAAEPEVALGLSSVGVTGVQKAVRVGKGRREKLIAATIDCTVDLDPRQKGVHMSRFPELFEEAIDVVVGREALLVEGLAAHIASRVVERQGALRAEVWIRAQWPIRRLTPVTGVRRRIGHCARIQTSACSAPCRSTTRLAMCSASVSTSSASPPTTTSIASSKSSGKRDM